MFKDIDIFVAVAQAIWNGQDAYKIHGVEAFYPLPFYLLFLPLAWLPLPVVHVLWSTISALVLVAVLRQRALITALSSQALLTFLLGQVDLVMMGLYALVRSSATGGGIALAFMVLKPQIVFLLTPFMLVRWWKTNRREIVWFLVLIGILTAASFLAQPDWVGSLAARSGERMRAAVSSSLWGLLSFLPMPWWLIVAGMIALSLVVWAWRTRKIDVVETVGLFISPFIFAYNLMPLYVMFRQKRVLAVVAALSWIGFGIAAMQSNDRGSALVAVFVLLLFALELPRSQPRAKRAEGET